MTLWASLPSLNSFLSNFQEGPTSLIWLLRLIFINLIYPSFCCAVTSFLIFFIPSLIRGCDLHFLLNRVASHLVSKQQAALWFNQSLQNEWSSSLKLETKHLCYWNHSNVITGLESRMLVSSIKIQRLAKFSYKERKILKILYLFRSIDLINLGLFELI